jgi:membrane protein implicated in regulation of membrane protease activity
MIGAGEIVFLAILVLVLYAALRPLRRRLEMRFARTLRRRTRRGRGRVVVLGRRRDGTFEREDNADGG